MIRSAVVENGKCMKTDTVGGWIYILYSCMAWDWIQHPPPPNNPDQEKRLEDGWMDGFYVPRNVIKYTRERRHSSFPEHWEMGGVMFCWGW